MIFVLGSVVARQGCVPEALALSRAHVVRSRAEPGCITHAVHQDSENPQRLVFVEQWASAEALWEHLKVPASRSFAKAVAALTAEVPSLAVYTATAVPLPGKHAQTERPNFQPPGWHTVTPRIIVHGAEKLVEFVKAVFGATGEYFPQAPAELRIGDAIIMVSEAGMRDPMPACLYVYVVSADHTWQRAVEAGAQSIETPSNTPYGDRRGMVKDQWGNTWQIATRKQGRDFD